MEIPSKFIQVGCWNNLNKNKNKEEGCIKTVMKLIKSHIKDDVKKTDFIVLSGDNYYPKKINKDGEKKKIIIKENLENGFKLLPDTLPIYMIMGNHDLETNTEDKKELFVKNEEEAKEEVEKDCKIIDLEFESIKKKNVEYNFFKDIMLKNGTLLLMIDTCIYEEDSNKFLPCYKKFFEKKNDNNNFVKYDVSILRKYQENLLITSIIKKYSDKVQLNNIIIIGHHPIIYLRYKGGDNNKTLSYIQKNFSTVLQNIYKTVNNTKVKYYYLCSDLHLYQHGTIIIPTINQKNKKTKMVIKQYIVGTGGAELDDPLLRPDSDKNKINLLNYQSYINDMKYIVHEDIQACGFLVCDILDKKGPTFTPILFDKKGNKVNCGGRKRRRMTKRKKLTKRKKRHYTKKI